MKEPNFKYWEFDIHESRDGVLFAFHDDEIEIDGTTNPVKEFTYSEIQSQGEENGIMIPTLDEVVEILSNRCLLYTSPSPRDRTRSRMPSSA